MAKTMINMRLSQELIDAMGEAALVENRDRTNMIEHALASWLKLTYPELWERAFPEVARVQKSIADRLYPPS